MGAVELASGEVRFRMDTATNEIAELGTSRRPRRARVCARAPHVPPALMVPPGRGSGWVARPCVHGVA